MSNLAEKGYGGRIGWLVIVPGVVLNKVGADPI